MNTIKSKIEKISQEIKEYENILSTEEWGNYKEFFDREFKDLHKDMYANGILSNLIEKEICQAKKEAYQEDLKLIEKFEEELKERISKSYAHFNLWYEDKEGKTRVQDTNGEYTHKKWVLEFIETLSQKYFKGNSQIDSHQEQMGNGLEGNRALSERPNKPTSLPTNSRQKPSHTPDDTSDGEIS